jgi:hypothetical protein
VCIFSFSHLIVLLQIAQYSGAEKAQRLLQNIFTSLDTMNSSKDAAVYWTGINSVLYSVSPEVWRIEKAAAAQALILLKDEAQTFLAKERERIMRLSRAEAVKELLKAGNLESRSKVISGVTQNQLFEVKS